MIATFQSAPYPHPAGKAVANDGSAATVAGTGSNEVGFAGTGTAMASGNCAGGKHARPKAL
jgi:hypothetical protein